MKALKRIVVVALVLTFLLGNKAIYAKAARDTSLTEGITVLKEYYYKDILGALHIVAVCENTVGKDCEVSWELYTLDSSGEILETSTPLPVYVNAGQKFVLEGYFMESQDAKQFKYYIHVGDLNFITPMHDSVSLTDKVAKNGKIILTATNNSSYELYSICAHILYFDANKNLIKEEEVYLTNTDYKVNPGETVIKDNFFSQDAASYAVYYEAYRFG